MRKSIGSKYYNTIKQKAPIKSLHFISSFVIGEIKEYC